MKIVAYNPHQAYEEIGVGVARLGGADYVKADDLDDLARRLPGVEILVTSNRAYEADMADVVRAAGGSLRWIQFTTSGIDKAKDNGMPPGLVVTNCAGARAFAVAEHGLFLMLALARQVRTTEAARPEGTWCRDVVTPSLTNLAGHHLVIIGTGAIGQEIARKAKAFDMRVTGVSRSQAPLEHFDALRPRSELVAACAEADIVMMAAVLDADTPELMSRAAIRAMKPTATFVNIGRGGLVDEPALIEALQAGRIAGAGLDVTVTEPLPQGHPLWSLPNVVLTPHIAGAGSPSPDGGVSTIVLDNLARWRDGRPLTKIVIAKT
jgi:phosphoglycerate dehydrogenase-like enzyme